MLAILIWSCLFKVLGENRTPKIVTSRYTTLTREFLYAEDAAERILLAAERYNKPSSVNLSAGFDISIKDLVGLITSLVNFEGKIF